MLPPKMWSSSLRLKSHEAVALGTTKTTLLPSADQSSMVTKLWPATFTVGSAMSDVPSYWRIWLVGALLEPSPLDMRNRVWSG